MVPNGTKNVYEWSLLFGFGCPILGVYRQDTAQAEGGRKERHMAATKPAADRIISLLTRKGHRSSPVTITRRGDIVYSYAMPIVIGDEQVRYVTNQRSSMTTNRHIRAAHEAMGRMGYVADPEPVMGPRYAGVSFLHFEAQDQPWTRYVMPGTGSAKGILD